MRVYLLPVAVARKVPPSGIYAFEEQIKSKDAK